MNDLLETEKPQDNAALLRRCKASAALVYERVYRLCYRTGLQTARLARACKKRTLRPLSRRLRALFYKRVAPHITTIKTDSARFLSGFSLAGERLAAAWRRHPLLVVPQALLLPFLAIRRHRKALVSLANLAAPVAAAFVLLLTVQYWTSRTFGLVLEVDGRTLGYISNETVYENAANLAVERVINTDSSFRLEQSPKLTLAVVPKDGMLDETALCDEILRTSGDSIAQASGLYINGKFEGSVDSRSELDGMLNGILQSYITADGQRASFVQSAEVVDGLYPISSLVTTEDLKARLTSPAVVEKAVEVQAGDTLGGIARANHMTLDELRELNPAVRNTDMVTIGQSLVVQREQPYLQVQIAQTLTYTETVAFTTEKVQDKTKYLGYEKVKTAGKNGVRQVTAEVVTVDGVEQSRTVLSAKVTQEPVTQVVVVGAKTYSAGTTAGDGKATGRFIWPVPGYTNIYSPYGYRWGKLHAGIDISQNGIKGAAIVAADGGRVVEANSTRSWGQGYGYYVVIDHGGGYRTRYAHCGKITVKVGQKVAQGQLIGYVGNTGNSQGYHLHFEVLVNGSSTNPVPYLKKK